MFFVVALGNLVAFFSIGVATNIVGQALTYRYRRGMLERMLAMDQQFFDVPSNSSAALASKLSSVPSALQDLMSSKVGLMASVLINVLATSVMGVAVGWKLSLVLVCTGLTAISGSGYLRIRLDQKLETTTERQFSSSATLAIEATGSIRTVSSLTLEREVLARYSGSLDSILAKVMRSLVSNCVLFIFTHHLHYFDEKESSRLTLYHTDDYSHPIFALLVSRVSRSCARLLVRLTPRGERRIHDDTVLHKP